MTMIPAPTPLKSGAEHNVRLVILIICTLMLVGCARPTGDFGRAKPGILHDEILPTIGKLRALVFGENVSLLNQTDEEVEMHDRAWRFIIAPHSQDWFFNVLVEWQRTRLTPPFDTSGSYDRYYAILRSERYRSSRVRYNRLADDIGADMATMPGVFRAICAVNEIDHRRAEAAASLRAPNDPAVADVYYRRQENLAYIDWFVGAARYRYNSYSYALESLLIETPHEGARQVDQRLSELAILVEQAERHDFCLGMGSSRGERTTVTIRSRMETKPFTPEPTYRK